jgi:hypothetical protein
MAVVTIPGDMDDRQQPCLEPKQTSEESERTLGIFANHAQRMKADSSTQHRSI